MNEQVPVFVELTSQVESISRHVFCWSCLVTPDLFGDDEALPDAEMIICVVNHVDTLPFASRRHHWETTYCDTE